MRVRVSRVYNSEPWSKCEEIFLASRISYFQLWSIFWQGPGNTIELGLSWRWTVTNSILVHVGRWKLSYNLCWPLRDTPEWYNYPVPSHTVNSKRTMKIIGMIGLRKHCNKNSFQHIKRLITIDIFFFCNLPNSEVVCLKIYFNINLYIWDWAPNTTEESDKRQEKMSQLLFALLHEWVLSYNFTSIFTLSFVIIICRVRIPIQ